MPATEPPRGVGKVEGGLSEGSGFAINSQVVITAGHVVRGKSPSDLMFRLGDGHAVPVDGLYHKEPLDIAVLHLAKPVQTDLRVGVSKRGTRWAVDPRTTDNAPTITGTVDQVGKEIKNASQYAVRVTQLTADQTIGNFAGYSGSAVVVAGQREIVTDVLVEQVLMRRIDSEMPAAVSNVLYAIPIQDALDWGHGRPLHHSVAPWIAAGMSVALITGAVIAFLAWGTHKPQPQPTTSTIPCCTVSPGPVIEAIVQNTWEETQQRLVGVYFYPNPDNNLNKVRGVDEGTKVFVVCQVRDGREVTDTPYRDRQTSSRVWDKMTNGLYISDIYTTLPKVDGFTPPSGLALCR